VSFERNQQPLFLQNGHSLSRSDYSDDIANEIDLEVRRIMDRQYERSTTILKSNADSLHTAAAALLTKETLTGDELVAIVTAANIRRDTNGPNGGSVAVSTAPAIEKANM
jgi:cell division protease FtsH